MFGQRLEMPIMSGAMSGMKNLASEPLKLVAEAMKEVGSLAWMGIGGRDQLVEMIDTGAKVVKISKPFRDTEKISKRVIFCGRSRSGSRRN